MAGGGVSVSRVALDDVVALGGKRIFIKMDIEGHELSAIRGMKGCAARNRIFLQVESFSSAIDRVKSELSQIGMAHASQIGDDHYFSNF